MTIDKLVRDDKTIFTLKGRLDTVSAPLLQEVLIPELSNAKLVELDFEHLAYVSSAGLRVLLMGVKTASAQGSQQLITGVSPDIMEIFEMTGFSEILQLG